MNVLSNFQILDSFSFCSLFTSKNFRVIYYCSMKQVIVVIIANPVFESYFKSAYVADYICKSSILAWPLFCVCEMGNTPTKLHGRTSGVWACTENIRIVVL